MKRLTLHRLTSLLQCFIAVNTMLIIQKSPYNSTKLSDTHVKAKTTKFFGFATENDFCQRKSSLLCINIFFL
jgi:hypothetical protein